MQQTSIQFLISLVEDILDISKIHFNKFHITEEWFSFNTMMREVLEMCNFQAKVKNIKVLGKSLMKDNMELFSDQKRIKQILVNLVTNAIKFTFNGTITITAALKALQTSTRSEVD